jgi:ATP-binding cassette subfamily F protein 3
MIHINDLTYRLGARVLFDSATTALPERARVGFVGRNGAGKTTLFRMIANELAPESGSINLPRHARMGRVEQEAPAGEGSLIDFVLSADRERTSLLAEAETATDAHRIADIQTRLVDIDAHAAPSRAARILAGLGFDEAAQQRSLSSFSGGWRMRVALAAVLFSAPDLLLLDEPTNYLDLEGTLWLVDYLSHYPATIIIISHDRDVLDDVCDHILHLDQAKLSLYRGNYTSFDRQRREQQALQLKHKKKQDEQRRHLQSFVDRFRAQATKASQAQSRLKMLARMEPVVAMADEQVLPFYMPSPQKPLSPPLIAMEGVSVGYDDKPILARLNLTISNDDRIGLLGANGNGKSTFAKLLAGRLPLLGGKMRRSNKLEIGFFAQHQIDDLEPMGTAYTHVSRLMPDGTEAKVRARCAQMGFPNAKADTRIDHLSGGEKARLLMGLSSFAGPHILILDEPTNHLDIDSRAALIEAINDYDGAIILISHDRYLLDACADRLWNVSNGTVSVFDGDMNDYRRTILERARAAAQQDQKQNAQERASQSDARKTSARTRRDLAPLKKRADEAEARIEKFTALIARVDEALAREDIFISEPERAAQLAHQRAELERTLAQTEDEWLQLLDDISSMS